MPNGSPKKRLIHLRNILNILAKALLATSTDCLEKLTDKITVLCLALSHHKKLMKTSIHFVNLAKKNYQKYIFDDAIGIKFTTDLNPPLRKTTQFIP